MEEGKKNIIEKSIIFLKNKYFLLINYIRYKSFRHFIPFAFILVFLIILLTAESITGYRNAKIYFHPKKEFSVFKSAWEKQMKGKNYYFWNSIDSIKSMDDKILASNFGGAMDSVYLLKSQVTNIEKLRVQYIRLKLSTALACTFMAFLLVIMLIASCLIIRKNLKNIGSEDLTILIVIFFIVVSLVSVYLFTTNNFAKGPVSSIIELLDSIENGLIVSTGKILSTFAGINVCVLIFSCCMLIYSKKKYLLRHEFQERFKQSRMLLYLSSLTLANGVILLHFIYSWPAVLNEDYELSRQFASSVTISAGIIFTGILLIIYIPVAISQRKYLSWYKTNQPSAKTYWPEISKEIIASAVPIIVALIAQYLGYKDS